MKFKVVLSHSVCEETVRLLVPHCEVVCNEGGDALGRRELIRRCADADALMAFDADHIDDEFLACCPQLKVIGATLKGCDNFDVEACTARGIWLCNVPDHLTAPTAELAIGLLLALSRNLIAADRYVRNGAFRGWLPMFFGKGLSGSTVGIIGMGTLGQAIARRLQGFEVRLLYHDLRRLDAMSEGRLDVNYADLESVVANAAYLLPMVPLTSATRHLIDAAMIARMQPGACLINACRGSVVDEAAVAGALKDGRLGGYAADVFAFEDWSDPERPDSIHPGLLAMRESTVLTPHLGSAVVEARKRIEREAAWNIIAALRGDVPPHAVNMLRRDAFA